MDDVEIDWHEFPLVILNHVFLVRIRGQQILCWPIPRNSPVGLWSEKSQTPEPILNGVVGRGLSGDVRLGGKNAQMVIAFHERDKLDVVAEISVLQDQSRQILARRCGPIPVPRQTKTISIRGFEPAV